jgi:nicotinate-nucleotide--dimethylbenzimidazole phosphoribosyltransferase
MAQLTRAYIETIRSSIMPVDASLSGKAQARLDDLTKPVGSLGRLEEFARRLVIITGNAMPSIDNKVVFTFAGDHGVTASGVSAYPKEVTPQMVFNFLNGGAAINVLSRHAGADNVVIDIGVDFDFANATGLVHRKVMPGTRNMAVEPAMTEGEAIECIAVGAELAAEYAVAGYSIFCTGDMGIGNTTPSSAIAATLTGRSVADVTGRGTGLDDVGLERKIQTIEKILSTRKPDPTDPIDVLSKVGGTEIGGIAGLILGAAARKIPVVVDGFISTAGAMIAYAIEPRTVDYMFAGHASIEIGQKAMLEKMGLSPVLDLGMRLGEGTGAVLALMVIEGGLKVYREMATFSEAGVSEKE